VWKDESEVNENAIPLWRGQGGKILLNKE